MVAGQNEDRCGDLRSVRCMGRTEAGASGSYVPRQEPGNEGGERRLAECPLREKKLANRKSFGDTGR